MFYNDGVRMKDRPSSFGPEHSRIADSLVESIHLNDRLKDAADL